MYFRQIQENDNFFAGYITSKTCIIDKKKNTWKEHEKLCNYQEMISVYLTELYRQ